MSGTKVKTRILIISDTHGVAPKYKRDDGPPDTDDELERGDPVWTATGYREPLPEADVVLHCGDLTKSSMIEEFSQTFAMLRAIRAPLKLVIAGNHDLALDEPYWRRQYAAEKNYPARVRAIVDKARVDGVIYLTEGTHSFDLGNGARLKVYASQFTPEYGSWAFQYPEAQHDFGIPPGMDVVMTHGPPKDMLDLTLRDERAGCGRLFQAVHRAKPKIHCFGHIHESWGAYLARWKEGDHVPDVADWAIDAAGSRPVTNLAAVVPDREDSQEAARRKTGARKALSKQRGVVVDLTDGEHRLEEGKQTLFVNAAIMSVRYRPIQLPWLVDVELPMAESIDV